jgi:hypothetical protein
VSEWVSVIVIQNANVFGVVCDESYKREHMSDVAKVIEIANDDDANRRHNDSSCDAFECPTNHGDVDTCDQENDVTGSCSFASNRFRFVRFVLNAKASDVHCVVFVQLLHPILPAW